MKPREIRKVAKRELEEGWLCVDRGRDCCVVFFPGKTRPVFYEGAWEWNQVNFDSIAKFTDWSRPDWRVAYGNARLPKVGKCERVRLEL